MLDIQELVLVSPEIWLLAMGCVILIADLFVTDKNRTVTFLLSQVTLVGAIYLTIRTQWNQGDLALSDAYIVDNVSVVLKVAMYGLTFLAFLYARTYLARNDILKGEFFTLSMFSVLGMSVLASAHSLLTVYMGLELMSLCLYALVAFDRDNPRASESAMKYFILGALSSGMLLYGMSMVYGATGSLDIGQIALQAQFNSDSVLLLFGLTFMLVGVAFKFGAVPFHMWVPDVYQGAPTPVTLFLGTAPKVAAVAMFMRLFVDGLGTLQPADSNFPHWHEMLILLSVLSLAVGNLFALVQTSIKRLLAYSTISHIGFIFLGFIANSPEGYGAALFYAITYAITAAGGFALVIHLGRQGYEIDAIDDFKGLFQRDAMAAWAALLFMFSMTGIPGTVGFFAKLQVLSAVVDEGLVWLAIVAVIFSVIGAFYYLRVLKATFFDAPADGAAELASPAGFRMTLAVNGLAVLLLGIFPGALLGVCLNVF